MNFLAPEKSSPAPYLPLNRSVVFLAKSTRNDQQDVLLLDRFEFALDEANEKGEIFSRIAASLDISFIGEAVRPAEFEALISDQFAAASEYVYGHPIWERIRSGSKDALYSYLLETRHHLAAAASRMSSSIGPGIGLDPLTLLLSHHLLEEWDHAKYFSDALRVIGCDPVLASTARPIPSTLEWIHATRAINRRSALSAAVCSGFMEYSSTETHAVRSWHAMLVEKGFLPAEANQAILGHLETDLDFDHADNWRRALRLYGAVTPRNAAEILNDVTILAEMIYRWLSAVNAGGSASIVYGIQTLTEAGILMQPPADHCHLDNLSFSGMPVWPSALMSQMNSGVNDPAEPAAIVAALAYAVGHRRSELKKSDQPLAGITAQTAHRLGSPLEHLDLSDANALVEIASSWLRSIDGHALWDHMMERSCDGVVTGYILENYHYLASATRHVSAAIASCTHTAIRLLLIEHLQDELEHCGILADKLASMGGVNSPESMRPLPTTLAFVGYLETLASQDWKAYILVFAFLQASLAECRLDRRNSRFYQLVIQNNPASAGLLNSIRNHDEIDAELDHDAQPLQALRELVAQEPLSRSSLCHAAVAPALAWSFLDGILQHYSGGRGAVAQRAGWRS
jgi:pyrroloquinoline quinone (PQQ) biosynthesis protein C